MTVALNGSDNLKESIPTNASPRHVATMEEVVEQSLKVANEAFEDPHVFSRPIRRAAVVGAGPAGLATAKKLRDRGIEVRVFETQAEVGGVWFYNKTPSVKPSVPSDKLAPIEALPDVPDNEVVEEEVVLAPETERWFAQEHPGSGCYEDLHCNTATPILQLEDFPWPEGTPLFVPHTGVCNYFKSFAEHFGLYPFIELNTAVKQISKKSDGSWSVMVAKSEKVGDKIRIKRWRETFDAVAVAAGSFQDPFIPDVKGLKEYDTLWPERVSHSKQFRHPRDFKGKNVLVVGGHVSAVDIVRHLQGVAENVYLSFRGPFELESEILNAFRSAIPKDIVLKPAIQGFVNQDGKVDGTVTFEDGTTLDVDRVIYCTGYMANLPFLGNLRVHMDERDQAKDGVVVDGKRPIETYHEIFHIDDPTLAFLGFPSHVTLVRFFSYQANAVARVWEGTARLPSQSKMRNLMENSKPSCPIDDLTVHFESLRAQAFITWLNRHAELCNVSGLKELTNYYGPELAERWVPMFEEWIKFSEATIAKTREKELRYA
ncbi:hypothetical protein EC973_006279 [Apophysomyces ossiformis]|uniref:Thiol-specific monooxygenase n=1 Tax=Apophysomyces ossiformis TaxID=679940 RepID=A0A8H7BQV0_9FUNG|nr:hypothetical protein EC973_006279 [Apophysomyces ossiformis]